MSCERYEEWISLAAGGDLDRAKATRLEGHLAACSHCRGLLHELGELRESLGGLCDPPVSEAELEHSRKAVWARLDRTPDSSWRHRLSLAAAAALLLGLALVALWRSEPGRSPAPPELADARPERSEPAARVEPYRAPTPTETGAPTLARSEGPEEHSSGEDRVAVASSIPPRSVEPDPTAPLDGLAPAPMAADRASVAAPEGEERLVVKLLPDDPDIVIYWIIDRARPDDGHPDEETRDEKSTASAAA